MSLTKNQIKFLKKKSHTINPIFQIGKNGINETVLSEIHDAIEKRELIKVQLLQNSMQSNKEVADYIENNSPIKVIHSIGSVLVLYKSSSHENNRLISDKVREVK